MTRLGPAHVIAERAAFYILKTEQAKKEAQASTTSTTPSAPQALVG